MNRSIFLPLALALATAAPAFAQHQGHGHAGHEAGHKADAHAPAVAGNRAPAAAHAAPAPLGARDFERLDTDRDGRVGLAELPQGHPLRGHFPMADGNRDGALDRGEFDVLLRMQ